MQKMLGVPEFDDAFVKLNQIVADNFDAATAKSSRGEFTVQQGGRHGAARMEVALLCRDPVFISSRGAIDSGRFL